MQVFGAMWRWLTRIVQALSARLLGQLTGRVSETLWACVRWILLLLLFAAIEYGLYELGKLAGVASFLSRFPAPQLKSLYLPLLGLLVILVGVVLYYFFATWEAEAEQSPYPDIDAAWQEAMRAVREAGILPHQVSLFLVLGRPESAEANLFDGAGVKWVVRHAPADPSAPLHVYAEKESSPKSAHPGAIYVTCRAACVLGKLAGILAHDESVMPAPAYSVEASQNALNTVGPVDRDAFKAKEIVAATQGREATILEKRKIYRAERGKPLGSDLMADTAEVSRLKARLAHLCRLIAAERGSECAANGVLLLIPLAGTDTLAEAQLTAQACIEDLLTAHDEMRIDCPVVSVLVDLEDLPGFNDFLLLQTAKELVGRRGCSFPMSTRLSRDELRQQIRTSLAWACTTYLQDSVHAVFQCENDANKDAFPLFPGNARLAMLLAEMSERVDAVCDIVLPAMMPENQPMLRYSGFYFAGTGAVGSRGFIAGIFQKLVKEQASVTWTQAALDADAECYALAASYTTTIWILLGLMGVVVAGSVYYFVMG